MANNTDNANPNAERLKALQAAMAKIEKDFGKGSIMKLGDESVEDVDTIPTGSLSLDAALGVGGYPKGRIIEIFGPESSGKTTLALHAIAEAQKAGGLAAFIDAEHALDRFYAAKLGVNTDDLLISQPDNGEQALEIADQLIRSSAIDIIVIDSVAALTPKAEIEGDMGDNKVGLQARLMSQALRKLTSSISKTNTTCIFINQLREKIGIMFGNPETTTGGNAPSPRENREEQGGSPIPQSGVRNHLRRRHLPRRRDCGPRRGTRNPQKERLMVQLRRNTPRAGTRRGEKTHQGQPRTLRGNRSTNRRSTQRQTRISGSHAKQTKSQKGFAAHTLHIGGCVKMHILDTPSKVRQND